VGASGDSHDPGGVAYGPLIKSVRVMLDRLTGAAIPAAVARELTAEIEAVSEMLARYQVPETERVDGRRPDLPGRGSLLVPPVVLAGTSPITVSGQVTLGRLYLGAGAAAHGGAGPLLLASVLGHMSSHALDVPAHAAYLHVNYRAITPLDVPLRVDASLDKVDGRKRWLSARLFDGDGNLVCDAESLFVTARSKASADSVSG
jgi:hypothetical protein